MSRVQAMNSGCAVCIEKALILAAVSGRWIDCDYFSAMRTTFPKPRQWAVKEASGRSRSYTPAASASPSGTACSDRLDCLYSESCHLSTRWPLWCLDASCRYGFLNTSMQ